MLMMSRPGRPTTIGNEAIAIADSSAGASFKANCFAKSMDLLVVDSIVGSHGAGCATGNVGQKANGM